MLNISQNVYYVIAYIALLLVSGVLAYLKVIAPDYVVAVILFALGHTTGLYTQPPGQPTQPSVQPPVTTPSAKGAS